MTPKNSPRMDLLLEALAEEIARAIEAGETDVHSWALFLLRSGDSSSVQWGGCDCCSCATSLERFAAVHAEQVRSQCTTCNAPKVVH